MTFLVDSSVLFELEKGIKKTKDQFREIVRESNVPCAISFMTYTEFLIGAESKSMENKAKLKEFIWNFPILNTTNQTALILSKLKYEYDKKGKKKSITDLFIAAQAIEHNLTLVTKDRDFEEIGELKKVII